MNEELMVSMVGGLMVWCLTWLTRSVIPSGEVRDAVRHWTPEIAGLLAVAVVAGWQVIDGNEVVSMETLKRALGAAGAAVFGHSLIQEKLKMMRKGRASAGKSKLLLLFCLFFLFGCGGSSVKGLEYLPDVKISNPEGCPDVSIKQNLPAPSGWSVMNETRIMKECPEPPKPPESPTPE